jgi:galactose mutarotase-like enzyme
MKSRIYHISNPILQVSISSKGAELQSIFHSLYFIEFLWQGDPTFWGKKSPILFPIVGGLKNGQYHYAGSTYSLPRHGFARDKEFSVTHQTDNSITFSLSEDEETLQHYPFAFILSITYTLEKNRLFVSYEVENSGQNQLYFSIGAHPAFALPMVKGTQFSDYYLDFNKTETAEKWPLNESGLIEDFPIPCLVNCNQYPLNKPMFYGDALVFKNLASNTIGIFSNKTAHGISVHYENFPYMGIWSARNADFICIEPWCGIADAANTQGNFIEKEGMNELATKEKFSRTWSVEVF